MLVLGVGAEIKQAPESIKAFLRSKAISLEIQDTVRKLRTPTYMTLICYQFLNCHPCSHQPATNTLALTNLPPTPLLTPTCHQHPCSHQPATNTLAHTNLPPTPLLTPICQYYPHLHSLQSVSITLTFTLSNLSVLLSLSFSPTFHHQS